MNMKKNTKYILIFIIIVFLTACQTNKKLNFDRVAEENDRNNDNNQKVEITQETIKGETIANALVDLTGIDDATALLRKDQAIVAVNVSEGEEGVITEELREKIIDTVKKIEEDINEIKITADLDLFYEIDNIQQSMIRGENLDTIENDIQKIINILND